MRLPVEGLVVLFGANSSGKTFVLEAVERLLTGADIGQTDPADIEAPRAYGRVTIDFPAAESPTTPTPT